MLVAVLQLKHATMKIPKRDICSNASAFPKIQTEEQSQLTSFAGIQIYSQLFASFGLKDRMRRCTCHLSATSQYAPGSILFLLITHIILGFSRLRDVNCYKKDPLVKRFLGMNFIPSASTVSRVLASVDSNTADMMVKVVESIPLQRLRDLKIKRVTIDFDGSITTTNGHLEGTAVGFNPKKKGQRSYYPLFATIPQLGQVLSVLHRSGNVHDSNKAAEFMAYVVKLVRAALPDAIIEVRADSAFYSDKIIETLEKLEVEFTISVPFERYTNLKAVIESRKRWRRINADFSGFDLRWKADSWKQKRRFLFVKKKTKKQRKGPIQLDLFIPHEEGYEFTAIVTNKKEQISSAVIFHHGRGGQEKMFAELKNGTRIDYLPCRKEAGNRVFMLCNILAHNLSRELQIQNEKPQRKADDAKRPCLWIVESLSTLRKNVIAKAGRITRPAGILTLTIPKDGVIEKMLRKFAPKRAFS
jgi:FixJ family two-component response regulator